MIKIQKSPTADTRTCDWSKVTKEELLKSSKMHIQDVKEGINFIIQNLITCSKHHDYDKISEIKWFHHDFKTGFEEHSWWDNHKRVNRHHINDKDGVPEDVNIIDLIEHIVDCVVACKARGGEFKDINLPNELLQQIVKNTTNFLMENIEIEN